jgi:hypothetical protein
VVGDLRVVFSSRLGVAVVGGEFFVGGFFRGSVVLVHDESISSANREIVCSR